MPGNFRTTYPTWHQPWACNGCYRHGEVIVHVTSMRQEWLRKMTRDIDAHHRGLSPMCPYDISSKPKGRAIPMVLGRPYRQSKNTGQRIYAEGPNETPEVVAMRLATEAWPPWMDQN